ncbi:MAG: hypothetical protein KDJ90_08540 [Nitratireductor sp.]|nr:hypothetical protein [Nitratireductor sp.]
MTNKPQRIDEGETAVRGKTDDSAFDRTVKGMLATPPKPHGKKPLTESDHQKKPGGAPAKKHRPASSS